MGNGKSREEFHRETDDMRIVDLLDEYSHHPDSVTTTYYSDVPEDKIKENIKIVELEKQIGSLKNIISQMNSKGDEMKEDPREPREVSIETIEYFVDEMMKTHNISYLPDFVEKKLYVNMYTILLNFVDHLTSQNKINLLGHQITFKLEKS